MKIRLTRIGKTKKPYYQLVVAEELGRRDGRFVETLGSYDPHANPPAAALDAEKTREWLAKGAQPSDSAAKILKREGLLEAATK